MDDVTTRPMRPVVSLIEENPDDFFTMLLTRLSSIDPLAASYIPHMDDKTHVSITELLSALLDGVGAEGDVEQSTLDYFRALACDYRRFGFTPAAITAIGEATSLALRELCQELPFETELFAERAVTATTRTMAAAVADSIDSGEPAFISASVVEVEKRSRRLFVVRLQAESELSYLPGQYLPVTASYLPNSWRYLCPSIPSNQWGQVEFHIQADTDDTLRLLAHSRPGDQWSIGTGRGNFGQRLFGAAAAPTAEPVLIDATPAEPLIEPDTEPTEKPNDLLFIAYGTGLAPLRAMMFELMNRTHPPRLHFFVGAEYPGELYELMGLWNFAATCPWLSVVPVSTNEEDAWWVQATDASRPPRGLHLPQVGKMSEIITGVGAWADRDVLIAGPEQLAKDIRRALIRRGTPPDRIDYLPC